MRDDPRRCPILWAPLAVWLWGIVGCGGPPPSFGPTASWKGHARDVVALAFSPDGRLLASRSGDAVKLWDLTSRKEVHSIPTDGSDFGSIAFSPDGRAIAETRAGVGARTWDVATGSELGSYAHPRNEDAWSCYSVTYGWGLAYAPDGRTLAAGGSNNGEDGFATLWDLASGQATMIGKYGSPVTSVAFASDGKTLALGGLGRSVGLFDPVSKREKIEIKAARAYLAPIAFAPDGQTFATASEDRTIKIWDTASGAERSTLKGHLKGIFGLAYHPDGRHIAAGDRGGQVYLWDVATRKPVAWLDGAQGKVFAVAFSPDGRWLASGGEDREVRLWDLSTILPARQASDSPRR